MSDDISKERKLKLLNDLLTSAEDQKYSIIINGQIANEIGNLEAVEHHQKLAVEAKQSITILKRKIEELKKVENVGGDK